MRRTGSAACGCILIVASGIGAIGCQKEETTPTASEEGLDAMEEAETGAGPLDALSRRFGRLRNRLRRRGYREDRTPRRMFVLEDHGLSEELALPVTQCTTLVALATGGVRQLSLALYNREGELIAINGIEGEGGLVHICPQGSGASSTYHVVIRSSQGSGTFMAGTFLSAHGEGDGFEGLFEGILAPRVPFQEVEDSLARVRSRLRGRGLLPIFEPVLDSVAEGGEVSKGVELGPERCYVAVARGDARLVDIDLLILDASGAVVARDFGSDAEPSVEHCPEASGRYTVHARAFEGAGPLGVLVFAGPTLGDVVQEAEAEHELLAESPVTADAAPSATLTAATSQLVQRGYSAPAIVVQDDSIAPGEVRTHEMLLQAGCSLVMGAAGGPETDLDLYVSGRDGRRIDQDTGVQPVARVGVCLQERSVVRIDLKSYGRRGRYAVATLRAPGISSLVDLRLEEATAALQSRGYETRSVELHTLAEGQTLRQRVEVGPGVCLAFAVSGDPSVRDVDVFLRDDAGNLVSGESGPAPFASLERCGAQEPEGLFLEVLAYQGHGVVAVARMERTE